MGTGIRMFGLAVLGMGPLLGREQRTVAGCELADSGCDGRADVVLFTVSRDSRGGVLDLRTAEDVLVEVGRTRRSDGDSAGWIAGRIWRCERVEKALSVWAGLVRPLSGSMTYRVIVRIRHERSFLRTELRRQVARIIGHDRPKWRIADPAQIEVWIIEHAPGQILAGLRLSTPAMRQRDGRAIERPGALRPTVASALVQLAGAPHGVLLDPCCGSGTILREAQVEGWRPRGIDIDPQAVAIARRNVPAAVVEQGDARALERPDASIGACVSNLPFGKQHQVPCGPAEWLPAALGEAARVTQPGGRVVLLCPGIPPRIVPAELILNERATIRLLGLKTTIWAYDEPDDLLARMGEPCSTSTSC